MPEDKKKTQDRNASKSLQYALGYLANVRALNAEGKKALAAECKRLGVMK